LAAARRPWAADLLHFWFHELGPVDWFGSGPAVDRALEKRYARWWSALRRRPAEDFIDSPATARAAVLLFDQVPRNVHRQSALAFASDPLARAIAKAALARGWDRSLHLHQKQFLAMPLMHSEDPDDQLASVAYFTALGDAQILRFARAHQQMIARFGRFPHRNAILGRATSERERAAIAAGFSW
jgi:uncharacterized protein (DUF924 family)